MNKLLLELAKTAGINPLSEAQFSSVLEAEVSEYDLEEFAKLIIKECLTVCEDVTEDNEPAIACYYKIKGRFK